MNGTLAGEVVGHHDHARDPEEDDVEAGDQHRRRQVAVEAAFGHRRFVRPAQRAERPQLPRRTRSPARRCPASARRRRRGRACARTSASLRPT